VAIVVRAHPGAVGHLRWAYYAAAVLEGYTVDKTDQVWTLEAHVMQRDAFKLTQRPLVFVAPYRTRAADGSPRAAEWRWPVLSFTISPTGHLVARLGAPD
jgi:hypothetical protein